MGLNNLSSVNNYLAIDYMLETVLLHTPFISLGPGVKKVNYLLFINTFYLYKLDASRKNIPLNSQNNYIS